jgi:hypothetical protein
MDEEREEDDDDEDDEIREGLEANLLRLVERNGDGELLA